jgi:hypothetical protein
MIYSLQIKEIEYSQIRKAITYWVLPTYIFYKVYIEDPVIRNGLQLAP